MLGSKQASKAVASGHILVESNGRSYVYDAVTNKIVGLPAAVARILDTYLREGAAELPPDHGAGAHDEHLAACRWLDAAVQEAGMFAPLVRKDFSGLLAPGLIESELEHGLACLVLGVTEQCNLRCHYCIYSGHYAGERRHQDVAMSLDVAIRSIDFFLHRAHKEPEPAIAFYGGEPLLRGEVVRECITHVRTHWSDRLVSLNVATNLTLLDADLVQFFVANDVGLAVSVDGPAHIHDHSRTTQTGAGSHATILGWLRNLRATHLDYLLRRVSITATFDANRDFAEVFEYFSGPDWIDLPIAIHGIKDQDHRSFSVSDEHRKRHEQRLDTLIASRTEALRTGRPFNHGLFVSTFKRVFDQIARRDLTRAQPQAYPNSTCVPGVNRLFVDSQGRLYPCEKLHIPSTSIGDCNAGFDIGRVRSLVGRMVDFCNQFCQECWAYRLCRHCLVHLADQGSLSPASKLLRCDAERGLIRKSIGRFVRIWEGESHALEDDPHSLRAQVRAHWESY